MTRCSVEEKMPSVHTFSTSPTLTTKVPSIGGTATHSFSRLRISRPPLASCARIVKDAQRIHVFLEILLERAVRQIKRQLEQLEHLVAQRVDLVVIGQHPRFEIGHR